MALTSAERQARYRERHKDEIRQRRNPEWSRETNRRWRLNNPEAKRADNRRSLDIRKAIINGAKDRPCADCGKEFPPCVMDFDHAPGTREMPRTRGFTSWSMSVGIDRLKAEIAKCEVVCANCHRLRHFSKETYE